MTRVCLTLLLLVPAAGLGAQELEPGLYQNAPVGINVAAAGYIFSTGNVLVDSSLPLEDGRARLSVVAAKRGSTAS